MRTVKRSLEQALESLEEVASSIKNVDSAKKEEMKTCLFNAIEKLNSASSACNNTESRFVVISLMFQKLVTYHYYSEEQLCSDAKIVTNSISNVIVSVVPTACRNIANSVMNGKLEEELLSETLPIVQVNEDGTLTMVTKLELMDLTSSLHLG